MPACLALPFALSLPPLIPRPPVILAASVADEHDFDLLLEGGQVGNLGGAMLPPLKMPIWENLSRLANVIVRVCMPPMERPAMARWG